jgi:hypothetical protein
VSDLKEEGPKETVVIEENKTNVKEESMAQEEKSQE